MRNVLIKPCPFCGSSAHIAVWQNMGMAEIDDTPWWVGAVICHECGAQGQDTDDLVSEDSAHVEDQEKTALKAIEFWNKRKTPSVDNKPVPLRFFIKGGGL